MITVKIDFLSTEVCLVENEKDIQKAKKYFGDDRTKEYIDSDDYLGLCCYSTKRTYIFVKNNQISVLAHECLHAVIGMCKDRGINDEETECYLLDYLIKNFITPEKNQIK